MENDEYKIEELEGVMIVDWDTDSSVVILITILITCCGLQKRMVYWKKKQKKTENESGMTHWLI